MQSCSCSSSSTCTESGERGGSFEIEILEKRAGWVTLRAEGRGAEAAFQSEPGGHRYQRVPPTEKRGRVHTSTITVAVLPVPLETEVALDPRDLVWSTCRPSGSGGQAMQKTESAVQLHHIPSGIVVRCESERSQTQNQATALETLRARLFAAQQEADRAARNTDRKKMIGIGARGDKRRTIREQDGIVTDHVLDVRLPLRSYLRGDLEELREKATR